MKQYSLPIKVDVTVSDYARGYAEGLRDANRFGLRDDLTGRYLRYLSPF